ncbi:MAG TPA: SDR family oxidoreductase, partial [Nitrososphaeraceae archaeon]|nr:SDR family oxidoreductase [Nitrososphaeraceae archaeon]
NNINNNNQPNGEITYVAVVTGSSTGIGFETSLMLARNGFHTYATIRDIQKSKEIERIAHQENLPIRIVEMDVDNDNSVKTTIEKIISERNRIDILVNNAGYGLFGALEDLPMEEIKRQYETNVFGVIRVSQNVLPIMRSQRDGIIINISSVSGLAGIPSQSVYVSTKYALEGLSESLSFEVETYGIKIILIEPGVINTGFVEDLVVPDKYKINKNRQAVQKAVNRDNNSLSYYNNTIEKFLSFYYHAMINAPHPKIVANEIIQAIEKVSNEKEVGPFLRVPVGSDAKKYSKLKRELTDNEYHKLLKKDLLENRV